ncbi:hypothetical protein HC928_25140 [bacterium]|nr:hypothetical protein [bacterium]
MGTNGSISTAFTINTNGNPLTLQADTQINVADVNSDGGNIEITSNNGDIATTTLISNGGDISLAAGTVISVNSVNSSSTSDGGTISLSAASDPLGSNPAIAFPS